MRHSHINKEEQVQQNTIWQRGKGSRQLLVVMCTVAAWTCSRGSPPPTRYYGIFLNSRQDAAWDSSENAERAYANSLAPIPAGSTNDVPFAAGADSFLLALQPDTRHGSFDKRFLALNDTTPSPVLASIKMIKGLEYVNDSVFRRGWIPIALIDVSDSTHGTAIVYPKLKLRGGRSWLFVRHDSTTLEWSASLVRIGHTTPLQDSLAITAALDNLPPAPAARFEWKDHDEIIWGTCAGNCCKVAATKAATQ